jgi:polysaccharide deacetylase family protein (PEP-CTERM system associated)
VSESEREFAQPSPALGPLYLFSVDLEDVRSLVPNGDQYEERVPANTRRILSFLAEHGKHCSFYATGDVARRYPDLIREIVAEGHEVGCHTSDHTPLDRHTPESFRDDIKRCLDDYDRAGVDRCVGFRAPIGSLIKETRWAYEVLQELGFTYSSSVLPAEHPLYGWPDFGSDVPCTVDGMWEVPTTLLRLPKLNIPFSGGVYFRVLPFLLIQHLMRRRAATGYPIFGYFHPYDVDTEQERFMHPEINDSQFYNWLLYYNRNQALPRVAKIIRSGYDIIRYDEYVERVLMAQTATPPA